jgi:hypothetical protein
VLPLPSATPLRGKIRMSQQKILTAPKYEYTSPQENLLKLTSKIKSFQHLPSAEQQDSICNEFLNNPGLIISVADNATKTCDTLLNSRIKIPKRIRGDAETRNYIQQKVNGYQMVQNFINSPDIWSILLTHQTFLDTLESSETLRYALLLSLTHFREADIAYSCLISGKPNIATPFTSGFNREINGLIWKNYEIVKLLQKTAEVNQINTVAFTFSSLQ